MSDENTNILSAINGRSAQVLVQEGEKTYIVDAVNGRKIAVLDGFFGGGGKAKNMTTEQREAYTPATGELIWDTTLGMLFAGDGVTPGGVRVGGGGSEGIIAGFRMNLDSNTMNQDRYFPIDSTYINSSAVTISAGMAYAINATSSGVTINAESHPTSNYGLEGHLKIFTANAGFIHEGANVRLATPLEPDAINYCTVRFREGNAIISVEDNLGGYIVVNGSTSGEGSLYYGITTSTNDYVAFDASLNGQTIPLAGAVAEGEKHVVGNGYMETTLTGSVNCGTSKFTVANLSLSNVSIAGGTMTLGDVFIPSGSTVAVSGGGLAVEKVSGNGGVIDLNGRTDARPLSTDAVAHGLTFVGCSQTYGSVAQNAAYLSGCTFSSCAGNYGVVYCGSKTTTLENCKFVSCTANVGQIVAETSNAYIDVSSCSIPGLTKRAAYISFSAKIRFTDCELGNIFVSSGMCEFNGSNSMLSKVEGSSGTVTLTSGAVLDLTGNTNATPIAPGGGGVVVGSNVTIYPSAGSASAVEITGGTFLQITNGGVVVGGGCAQNEIVDGHDTATLDITSYGFGLVSGATLKNFTVLGGLSLLFAYDNTTIKDCTVDCRVAVSSAASCTLAGTVKIQRYFDTGATAYGTYIIASGAIIDFTGNANPTPINPTGTSATSSGAVVVDGGCTVITSAGASVSIAGGTYTQINNDGTTE